MSRIFVFAGTNKVETENESVVFVETVGETDLSEKDIFVSYTHSNPVEFRLDEFEIPSKALVITTKNKKLDEVMENEKENYEMDYSLFSGREIKKLAKNSEKSIISSMKLLTHVLFQMFEAGHYDMENTKKIDDWIPSMEEPTLKLLILYHQITTSNPDKSVENEFITNPQFRFMLMEVMMKVLANFIVNNKMISTKEVSTFGSWDTYTTWKKINFKLKMI